MRTRGARAEAGARGTLVAALAVVAATTTIASAAPAASVCLYNGKAYSDGAYLCVATGLMLGCAVDGDRVRWKPVAERDLADRCGGVAGFRAARPIAWAPRSPSHRPRPAAGAVQRQVLRLQRQALLRVMQTKPSPG